MGQSRKVLRAADIERSRRAETRERLKIEEVGQALALAAPHLCNLKNNERVQPIMPPVFLSKKHSC